MTAPNMATITASLERSLQNFSLNQSTTSSFSAGAGISSSSSDSPENHHLSNSSDATLELNSQASLPYHWEQCLDLKTGEIYYINWRTGMRATEDPRTSQAELIGEFDTDDDSEYDSEESSSESSPSSSRNTQLYHHHQGTGDGQNHKDHVLVVAGCKSCLMYFMVPKQGAICPKCCGELLHFDRSENGSP
ncbi:hypothetical protein NMG60_11030976 [Bertholletia excelsa]